MEIIPSGNLGEILFAGCTFYDPSDGSTNTPGAGLVETLSIDPNNVNVYVHCEATRQEIAALSKIWEKKHDEGSWDIHTGIVNSHSGWKEIKRSKGLIIKLIGEGYYEFINYNAKTGKHYHYEKNGEDFYLVARHKLIKDEKTGNERKVLNSYYRLGTNLSCLKIKELP